MKIFTITNLTKIKQKSIITLHRFKGYETVRFLQQNAGT